MELQTTIEQYWKNTICASEAALGLLSAFEDQGNSLINDTIKPLRKLVEKGRDFESLKSFNTKTPKSFNNNHNHYELEPNWTKEDDKTIHVSLGNQNFITAIAITTEAQLEAIIPEIYRSQYIAIDCEFLGIKKELPVLKLLQIAVSKEKGYAIQVDLVGVQAITRHLKPVLENDDVNLIGWAYRGDAMAIECFIKDIELGSVLDLQAKLKPIAVEELSLNSAVARYASDWEGLESFMTIKQFRDTFSFSTYDCIWTKDPLPAKALVYSVFDVVCLVALYEATLNYPTLTEHYWPYTVTQGSNRKAVDRWHRQRAISRNSSPSQQSLMSTTKSPPNTPGSIRILSSNGNSSSKNSTSIVANAIIANSTDTTNDFYDDNDPRYIQDIQEAIKRSKQEYMSPAAKQDKASNDNLNWFEEEEKDMELCDSGDDWRKELNEKKGEVHFGEPNKTVSASTVPIKSGSWDNNNTFEDANPDDLSWTKPWPYERRIDSPRSPRGSSNKPAFRQNAPRSVHSPKQNFTSPRNNYTRSAIPNQNISHFQSKPSRDRYRADLKNRVTVGDQSGEFTWGPVNKDELAEESWSHFAKESEHLWDKGIDADLKDIEKKSPVASPAKTAAATKTTVTTETDTKATSTASTPPYQANKKFNTTAKAWNDPKSIPSDDWETVDERPRTMEMPMNQIPIRSRFLGPKVSNIFDDDDDDDDDEDDDTHGPEKAKKTEEEWTTWVDDVYLEDIPNSLSMHIINKPDQLDMVQIPSEPFLAAITYHATSLDKNDTKPTVLLKALQIFIATETTGESYTIVLDQACLLKDRDRLATTKVGYLLTDPKVKRLIWFMEYIRDSFKDRLGFPLGPSIDVSYITIADQDQQLTFPQAVDIYLNHWPDYKEYCKTKKEKEKASHKSFGYAPWDEKKLRRHELEYSAFGGLALYKLYKSPKSIDIADEREFVV
ncbi:hypothetical protein G6F37_005111 [Rhizopus arrhizus]|nr:hypothetical protein G6F38_005259 [Rhizopus arrhizus]KAG1159205.1 hypothetical protein G6F37_005111 [Rhizopus arrhizus]